MSITLYEDFFNNLCSRYYSLLRDADFVPAIIFDIDDTIINIKEFDFEKNQIIPPIYAFFKFCMNEGIDIFIVTARQGNQQNIDKTVNMLINELYLDFNKIYFREPGERNVWAFKQQCRNAITDMGYQVIMSLGDNDWDIGINGGLGVLVEDKPYISAIKYNEFFY